jgi:hypothetical protein
MEWQVILALVLVIPVLLIPVALIWYINIGGIYLAIKDARERRATHEKETLGVVTVAKRK